MDHDRRSIRLTLNGHVTELTERTLADVVEALGHEIRAIATAVNGEFIGIAARQQLMLKDGDLVEIVAPRQGG